MKRYLYKQILEDLKRKMVFLTGPRQVGKTYLAKQLMSEFKNPQYLNFDSINDRRIINNMSWAQNSDLVIFDEIHKMSDWKNYLKGVFDTKNSDQSILVAGSARLDFRSQSGESLAGRYYQLRLHPVSFKEVISDSLADYDKIELLIEFGGFPEPFLFGASTDMESAKREAARWRKQYYTGIIREDIITHSRVEELNEMSVLLQLLRTHVGSPISINTLVEDLQISNKTLKRYIAILESLYIVFMIYPYHKNIARSILKQPKLYFFDTGFVQGNKGLKFENLCALSLLKYVHYLQDTSGEDIQLNYLRNRDKKEVDFVIVKNGIPILLIETKLSDNKLSKPLLYFSQRFSEAESLQIVHNLRQNETRQGINIVKASDWFDSLPV